MTDHNHDSHGQHAGGHEVDQPPTRELFNIIWGLSALTLLSLATCVQLFNNQARDLTSERGKDGSFVLQQYRKDMETRTRGSGEDTLTDATGKITARYNYIPLASARELILSKPEKLGAFPPPAGWVHPDDIASGGQGAAPAPAPTPVPTDGAAVPAVPADGAPAGAVPPGTATGTVAVPAGTAAPVGTPPAGTPPVVAPAAPAATPPAVTPPAGTPPAAPAATPPAATPPAAPAPGH